MKTYATDELYYDEQELDIAPQSSMPVQIYGRHFSVLNNTAKKVGVKLAGQQTVKISTAIGVEVPFAADNVTEITFVNDTDEVMTITYAVSHRAFTDNRVVLTADSIFTMRSGQIIGHGAVDVADTATEVVAADAQRTRITIQNLSAGAIYIGGSAVDDATGIKVEAGGDYSLETGAAIYAAAEIAGADVRYLEQLA